ncbi:MAG: protein kinase [Actinomycetota bacterium]|nr:protein kinase [Actinomycetota bacterium]
MSAELGEGTRLGDGRYVLRSRLGSGGAATVWCADDEVLERSVAVKVLSEGLASDESWLARFRREARLAASLSHPNLVSVYDFNADSQRPYIVMAHMPGGSLYERIQSGDHPEPEQLVRDLLSALEAIHGAGIIHRDIKPGNVLLAADGTACLTDFGVARPEDATSLTQTGHIPGTARFMAPELWQGHPADERSDLYAAGVLLRQAVGDDASPELHGLIESLASEAPGERPASASQALDRMPTHAFTPTAPQPIPPHDDEPTPRTIVTQSERHPNRRAALVGLAALAVVAAVGIAIAVGGGGDDGGGNGNGARANAKDSSSGQGQGDAQSDPATSESTTTPDEEPVDAVALDMEGKALIDAGDPEAAVPLLQQAVNSYPEDSTDINYAFSLYNLGNALLLSGRPEEAIPFLEKRLTFDNQTEVVQATLDEALAAAGLDSGKKKGKKDD